MKQFFTLTLFFVCQYCFAQRFPVDTIHKSGDIDKRINVLILGDGFTEAQLPAFTAEAQKFATFFLDYAPYNAYRNYFNFFSIATPSRESGITNPGKAPDAYPDQPVGMKDTYYGVTFGEYVHRLVTVTRYQAISEVLAFNFPAYDLVIMLANTPFYGGSGGSVAVHTLHEVANRIGVHEVGHTFSSLNDEYWAGPQYGFEAANMTAERNRELVKWKKWLTETNIGVFSHGEGEAAKWFKPTHANCLMEFLDKSLCAVCKEATTERILQFVSPIDKTTPDMEDEAILTDAAQTFKLDLVEPNPNTLHVAWTLNGKPLKSGTKEVTLTAADLEGESGLLTASVFDSTYLSRRAEAKNERTFTAQWRLLSSNAPLVFKLRTSANSICPGEFATLTTSGCAGSVSWSTGEAGGLIRVSPTQNTEYSATCKTNNLPDATLKITIGTFAKPTATASNTGPYLEGATIEIAAGGGLSYFWSGPDGYSSQTQVSRIENAKTGNSGSYEVRVVDSNGCADTATTEVRIDRILAVEALAQTLVQVSPNPAKGLVKIKTEVSSESVFTLFDIGGRKILDRQFIQNTEINLNGRSPGMYVYKWSGGGKEISGKLLVE